MPCARRVGAVALGLACGLASGLATALPPRPPDAILLGNVGVPAPERNDAGNFYGTWYYANRDWRVALWIEDEAGLPQIKMQFLSTATGEGFETEWGGQATYTHENHEGHFAPKIEHRDANAIDGVWNWTLGVPGHQRIDHGNFSLYRIEDGRQLVLKFTDFERIYEGKDLHLTSELMIWTFRKASRYQALWPELPF